MQPRDYATSLDDITATNPNGLREAELRMVDYVRSYRRATGGASPTAHSVGLTLAMSAHCVRDIVALSSRLALEANPAEDATDDFVTLTDAEDRAQAWRSAA
jgi:hypothetical protein